MKDKTAKMGAMFGGDAKGGFFDLDIYEPGSTKDANIILMGTASATPYLSVGAYCRNAPDAVRGAFGWPGVLQHHDFDVGGVILENNCKAVDWGNLSYHETDFSLNRETIRQAVESTLAANAVPIVIGGDDSVPIPVLQAYEKYGPLTILQIDAHIDWRDDVGGEKLGLSSNMRRASEMGWVENIIQVAARGIGSARPSDFKDAVDWGVQFFPMAEVHSNGLQPVLNAIPENTPVFITVDIDGLDPSIVPGVIGPAPGGLDYWQAVNLIKGVAEKNTIAGFDLVEFMPENDIGGRSALVAARLIAVAMAMISRQRNI